MHNLNLSRGATHLVVRESALLEQTAKAVDTISHSTPSYSSVIREDMDVIHENQPYDIHDGFGTNNAYSGSINRYCPGRTPGERKSAYDTKMTYIYGLTEHVKFLIERSVGTLDSMLHEEHACGTKSFRFSPNQHIVKDELMVFQLYPGFHRIGVRK